MDVITLALAKAYAEALIRGEGAIQGVGVGKIEQTVVSTESGGLNVWTATLTNGDTFDFQVRNGLTGPQGAPFTYADFTPEQLTALTGPQGEQGPQDIQGVQGEQGIQGEKGDTGEQGPQGIQGVEGPQGPQGLPGESAASAINPRGDYDAAADPPYTNNDYITHTNGNTYVCKADNPANTAPTTGRADDPFWQLLALQGAQGPQGEQGIQGPQGETGPQGEAGTQGPQGEQGIQGVSGVTFTPSVAADGTISWTNDGGLENPEPQNIKGEKGEVPIDDAAVSEDSTWSSKQINTAKLLTKGSLLATTNLGMTLNGDYTVQEFFSLLIEKYGTSGCVSFAWSDNGRANVVYGDKKVSLNGGILLWSGQRIDNAWRSITAIYIPHYRSTTSNTDSGSGMYKMYICIGDNTSTPQAQSIEYYKPQTTADVAKTTITALSGSAFTLATIADNHYLARNGVCYFQIALSAGSITSGTQYTIYSGLPKPVAIADFVVPYYTGSTNASPVRFRVTTAGALQVSSGSNTGGGVYVCSGSYPVA